MAYSGHEMFGPAINGLELDQFFSSSRRNGGLSEQYAPQAYPAMYSSMVDYQTVSNCGSLGGLDAMHYGNPLAASVGEPFPATVPTTFGDGYSSGMQGMYMGGFPSYSQDPYIGATNPYIDPFHTFGTPDLSISISPSSSQTISPFRSPVDEYAPDPQLLIPQPSLAGPSAQANVIHQSGDLGIEYGFGQLNMSMPGQHEPASFQLPSFHDSIATEERSLSGSNIASPIGTTIEVPSPSPPPPPPSSLPPLPAPLPAPPKEAQSSRKTRSSTSEKARSTKPTKASAPTSRVPCTDPGCKRLFFDQKTRDRHARTHNQTPEENYYCPGMYLPRGEKQKPCRCKPAGYTREDALLRHLRAAEPDNPCVIAANKIGWDTDAKGSVQKLRGNIPLPPPPPPQ